jgi:hypothetical protein
MTSGRRFLFLLAILATAATLSACSQLVDPKLPSDATPFSAPVVYARWWAMTQACSGLTGSLGAVSWYSTSDTLRDPNTGRIIEGYWSAGSNRVVLDADAKLDGSVVRHEMLHALLHEGGHSRAQFLARCAGVVSCSLACVSDAGPAPPVSPGTVQVLPAALVVAITVEPAAPTATQDGGFFTITVTATNPASDPVTVLLPLPARPPRTFAFDLTGPSGRSIDGVFEIDESAATFAPGETKQQVFDFVIGQLPFTRSLPPGNYTVVGSFGGKEAPPISVVLQ